MFQDLNPPSPQMRMKVLSVYNNQIINDKQSNAWIDHFPDKGKVQMFIAAMNAELQSNPLSYGIIYVHNTGQIEPVLYNQRDKGNRKYPHHPDYNRL